MRRKRPKPNRPKGQEKLKKQKNVRKFEAEAEIETTTEEKEIDIVQNQKKTAEEGEKPPLKEQGADPQVPLTTRGEANPPPKRKMNA